MTEEYDPFDYNCSMIFTADVFANNTSFNDPISTGIGYYSYIRNEVLYKEINNNTEKKKLNIKK